ncbi:hypothetical protein PRIPAC_90464, partial [Pristionchus pacificus]
LKSLSHEVVFLPLSGNIIIYCILYSEHVISTLNASIRRIRNRIMSEFILIPPSRSLRTAFHIPKKYETYQLDSSRDGSNGVNGFFVSSDGRTPIVVKKFVNPFSSKDRTRLIYRELDLLENIRHSNIAAFIESYVVDGYIYRITEYCGPALKEVIWKESYTVQDVKRWTRELLSAVRHLHEKGIIHRNLKPEAMCIHPKSKELTLIGFGAARGMDRSSQMTVAILPEPYTAIEIAMKWKEYDEKVDIWSLTAIICEMLSGSILFYTKKNQIQAMMNLCGPMSDVILTKDEFTVNRISQYSRKCTRKDFIEHLKKNIGPAKGGNTRPISQLDANDETNLRDFIERTLQFDPEQRLSADEALAHPFLKVDKRKYRALEDKYETVMNPKERIVAKLSYAPVDEQQIKRAQMSQEQLPDFKSKFAAEFSTKRVIGVGGFGVVFEVEDIRNKASML